LKDAVVRRQAAKEDVVRHLLRIEHQFANAIPTDPHLNDARILVTLDDREFYLILGLRAPGAIAALSG